MIERDIEKLWGKFEKMIHHVEDDSLNKLIEEQGQRIVECSYSQRDKEPFCGVAGLVDYSLNLLINMRKLNEALGYQQSPTSIIKVALTCDLGRIGDINSDRFVITTSDWHKEKLGQYYDWNESCPKFNVQDMSLWFLQHYNVKLDWNEWQAILLSKDYMSEDNKFYSTHRDRLAVLTNIAKQATLKNEIDKINGVYTVPF